VTPITFGAQLVSFNARQNRMTRLRIPAVNKALKRTLTLRRAVAIALIVWCAGAGCMVVSYARGAMSAEDSTSSSPGQSMAGNPSSMDAHACCKARHKALKRAAVAKIPDVTFTQFTTPLPARGNAMSCCPLTSGSLVIAARSQTDDSTSDLAPEDSSALKLKSSHDIPVTVPLRLPNRARSYLLDCAFLI
jgi:hypothetical protein